MNKNWGDLTLEEAVAHAKTVSRQALHIAIKTYIAKERTDVVDRLREVRKIMKRHKRIAKVGLDAVEKHEARKARQAKT